jgi:hypothetical protein
VLVLEVRVSSQKCFYLGFDRLRQHPTSALAQHRQQRIIDDAGSWPAQPDNTILLHGVSFLVTSTITEDTPPPTSSTKSGYSPDCP